MKIIKDDAGTAGNSHLHIYSLFSTGTLKTQVDCIRLVIFNGFSRYADTFGQTAS